MKPVTVKASVAGDVTEYQHEGLNLIVKYLANSLIPGYMLPDTVRIVVDWGDEDLLALMDEKN